MLSDKAFGNSSQNLTAQNLTISEDFEFNNRLLLNVVGYSIMLVVGTVGNTAIGVLSYRQNCRLENKGQGVSNSERLYLKIGAYPCVSFLALR